MKLREGFKMTSDNNENMTLEDFIKKVGSCYLRNDYTGEFFYIDPAKGKIGGLVHGKKWFWI